MKKLVMFMLVGLLLPVEAFEFDIRCKDYNNIDYFVLTTEDYKILTCNVREDYRGACNINKRYYENLPMAYKDERSRGESLSSELLKTIEPIYKQYVQEAFDNGRCKVFDKDLNDITPYSKKTEVKKEPETESPKEDEEE